MEQTRDRWDKLLLLVIGGFVVFAWISIKWATSVLIERITA